MIIYDCKVKPFGCPSGLPAGHPCFQLEGERGRRYKADCGTAGGSVRQRDSGRYRVGSAGQPWHAAGAAACASYPLYMDSGCPHRRRRGNCQLRALVRNRQTCRVMAGQMDRLSGLGSVGPPSGFCRAVSVTKPVAAARLYICGLGLYQAAWNGRKIGDELLAPYCTNYDGWVQYQTYDITRQVQRMASCR